MPTTITAAYRTGFRLTSASQNPVTITGNGSIDTGNAAALYCGSGVTWQITSLGWLAGAAYGIDTEDAATIVEGGGLVQGGLAGISVARGPGAVDNAGAIAATGAQGIGVQLGLGGQVSNGLDDGAAVIEGAAYGVRVDTQPGNVANAGTIAATGAAGVGVALGTGGLFSNGVGNPGAVIFGAAAGVSATGASTMFNTGVIAAPDGIGVARTGSGPLVNGTPALTRAVIDGGTYGVLLRGSAAQIPNALWNLAVVVGGSTGVELGNGGVVTNGASDDAAAWISGGLFGISLNGQGTVVNYGEIAGTGPVTAPIAWPPSGPIGPHAPPGGYGVDLQTGGSFINGSGADIYAVVYGAWMGVKLHGGDAVAQNYGTIIGGTCGIYNYRAGLFTNGSSGDTSALLSGGLLGFRSTGPGQEVFNYATITSGGSGVNITAGGQAARAGTLVNGSVSDSRATIRALLDGVTTVSGAIVSNDGTIIGDTGVGAYVAAGGTVVNGAALDTAALILGNLAGAEVRGTYAAGGPDVANSVVNDGIIAGAVTGVALPSGGVLFNGAGGVADAFITATAGAGAAITGGTLVNYGVITSSSLAGVTLTGACEVFNTGAASLIEGANGLVATGGPSVVLNQGVIVGTVGTGVVLNVGTLIDSGTIIGANGVAVLFGSVDDRLVMEPGAQLGGVVDGGGGGTVELAAGAPGSVGSALQQLAAVTVDADADWTLSGVNSTAVLDDQGTLQVAAGGSLTVTQATALTGRLQIGDHATLDLAAISGASAPIQFLGAETGRLDLAVPGAAAASADLTAVSLPLLQDFGAAASVDLGDVAFAGASLAYDSAAGLLQVSAGPAIEATLRFDPATLGPGMFHASDDGNGSLLITHG